MFSVSVIAQTRVACVGNSITAGYGTSDWGSKAWPAQFAKMMGSGYDVRNFGVSGTTMLKNGSSPYWNTQQFIDAKNFNPQILIIGLGTNDAWWGNWNDHKYEFYNNYVAMINEFRQGGRNPEIYVCFPPPIRDNSQNWNLQYEVIPYIQTVRDNMGTRYIDFFSQLQQSTSLFPDGLHPDDHGAYVMAQLAFNAVTGGVTNLSGTYALQNRNSGMFLDVEGGSVENGGNLIQWPGHGGVNQQFRFTHLDNGVYSIVSVASGKSVDIEAGSVSNNGNAIQWDYHGANNQRFTVLYAGDGYYKIKPVHSGRVLDVAGGSTVAGANVLQWDDFNQTNAQWKFYSSGSKSAEGTDILTAEKNIEISVYPSMVADFALLTNVPANTSVKIFTITGKLVQRQISNNEFGNMQLDFSVLEPGMYYISIDEHITKPLRIIKL